MEANLVASSASSSGASRSGDPPAPGMVPVPGGTFLMGSDRHYPEEAPAHPVTVDAFWMDAHPVTNREFARFIRSTGHITSAEQAPDPTNYPRADPDLLVAASSVFVAPDHPVSLDDAYQWWRLVPGADWRHPQGPTSSIRNRPDHPVVHVAWDDVAAYAAWIGKEIPAEAEWERAARGGLEGADYAWGDELSPGGRWMANTWQCEFPFHNTCADGYAGTSPVGMYPANGYGLLDMIGNVWEWTSDWYADHAVNVAGAVSREGSHPRCCAASLEDGRAASTDPRDPAQIPRRVMKGGSHLCAGSYCRRYRPAARMPQPIDTSTSHLGFRLVART
jgi:formylglycine-generating enzyme required for sulfatase activity